MYSFIPQERQDTVQQVEQADLSFEDDTPPDHRQDAFDSRKEDDVDDLAEVLRPKKSLSPCNKEGIQTWLQGIYTSSRGFELGTFDGSVLATTMKKQSSKWIEISLGFVSDVIVIVHRFITAALHSICSDRHVRDTLFATLLDGLLDRYRLAIRHVHFLLTVERDGIPITVNQFFKKNLQKRRQARLVSAMEGVSISDCRHGRVVKLKDALQHYPMSNTNYTIQDIHDILAAYYKVACKRFADNICQQATDHFLLNGADTPLRFFSPVFVGRLSTEELERIAGEAPKARRKRMDLCKEIANLTAAREIVLKG
ncbi:MAG: hypothetical protein FE78DRAFT_148659 [Acidomyces sp. 'richmondensis']|nr:MAG: hypothetical protein FE78DRAFT_148659 [Acidomyces sp. 'richmondensis']